MGAVSRDNNQITEGNLIRAFIMFLLPLMATSVLQQSYVIADGLILGNCINEEAMGSVSSISPIFNLLTLIQIGLSGGCSICVSHLYGGRDYAGLKKLIIDIIMIVSLISVAFAGIGGILSGPVLRLLNTPEELFAGAQAYLVVVCIGVPFSSLYSLQSGVLRGMGDSRKPLGGIAVSTAINIFLDILLVVTAGWGIIGAGIATVAAEALSAIYLATRIQKKIRSLDIREGEDTVDSAENVKEVIRLGVPEMIQSAFSSAGNILIQNATNSLGAFVVIGVSAAFKIDSLIVIPLMSMAIGTSVFVGQNTGAGHHDRVRKIFRIATVGSVLTSLVMSAVLYIWGESLLGIFGLSAGSVAMGYKYICICLPFYWVFGLQFVFNGFLQGIKNTAASSAYYTIALLVRVSVTYLAISQLGATVLPIAESVSWCAGALLGGVTVVRYLIKIKK